MRFSEADIFSVDTETTGLYYPTDEMFGLAVAVPSGESVYFDIRHNPGAIDWFNDELSRWKGRLIVNHNIPFDYKMLYAKGIELPIDKLDDTSTRACLIDEQLPSYALDDLCARYIKERKVDIYAELAEIFGGKATRNAQMPNLYKAHPELVGRYAKKDPILALKLWQWQEEEIERQGIRDICDFERRVMPWTIRAMMRGIRVDIPAAEQAMKEIDVILSREQKKLNDLAGFSVNVNSSPQIRKIFNPKQVEGVWVADNGTILEPTDSGNPSIDAEALRDMEGDERAKSIVLVRSLIKTKDTFLGSHILKHEVNGRVYPTINQNKGETGGTGSGRFSYVDPALQQIPSRNKEVARIVKSVFLPEEGQIWVDADKHSFEVRVFAHLVNDERIIDRYRADPLSDFHQMVADLTHLPRNATFSGQANAKQLNLSMIFNSGNGAIADKMGMPWEIASFKGRDGKIVVYKKAGDEAMEVINMYHSKLPGVMNLADRAKNIAIERGYIKTRYGRRFRFKNGYKAYKASGIAIQMTAADINKNNWIEIGEELEGVGSLLLNTHDSYSMSLPEDWQPHWKRVKERVENAYPWFRVPLILELSGAGKNWWEAVK